MSESTNMECQEYQTNMERNDKEESDSNYDNTHKNEYYINDENNDFNKDNNTNEPYKDTIKVPPIDVYKMDQNEQDEKKQLEELLEQKRLLDEEREKQLEKEIKQHIEDVRNNLAIFLRWIKASLNEKNLYKSFSDNFTAEYRMELFENICEFFKDDTFITDEILFYWKYLVVFLLRTSKKYKSSLDDLVFNLDNQETNLRLVKEKYIFRCFIDDSPICYFKENGTDYYVS